MTAAVVNNQDKREQRVKNVFRVILQHKASSRFWRGAQHFARGGLELEGKALKDWVWGMMWMMCSLKYWRGDEARRCKKVLKEYGGVR